MRSAIFLSSSRKVGFKCIKMVINERNRMLNNREKSADQSKTVRFSGVVVINTYDQMERASENRLNTENYKDEVSLFNLDLSMITSLLYLPLA